MAVLPIKAPEGLTAKISTFAVVLLALSSAKRCLWHCCEGFPSLCCGMAPSSRRRQISQAVSAFVDFGWRLGGVTSLTLAPHRLRNRFHVCGFPGLRTVRSADDDSGHLSHDTSPRSISTLRIALNDHETQHTIGMLRCGHSSTAGAHDETFATRCHGPTASLERG